MSKSYHVKSIKASKKNYFDCVINKETYTLHTDTVMSYHLLQKPSLTESDFKAMMRDNSFNDLMQKAINFLGKKHYSKQALKNALKAYDVSYGVLEQVIVHLESLGYIDDEKALQLKVDDALNFELKGPEFLRQKLLKEGFSEALINDQLKRFKASIQRDKIQTIIQNEASHLKRYPIQKQKEKLYNQLRRKGFSHSMIHPLIDAYINEAKKDSDEEGLIEKRVHQLKNKYNLNDFKEKQKLIQKLMREGFTYDLIKRQF